MSEKELELFELTGTLANKFFELQTLHPSDKQEFVLHIHAIQNMILARPAYRAYKNIPDDKT